ncbi:hypothetical protein GDO86_002023 [Hymenochirus boettgeri]|uniref:SUI1 domain-containing protein n=1 Tax=Hymenochirus boettgeri TaxID=247094 RepID=A0A8T2KHV3_9PIPI|nr:hypothetical protein GDO86_002023 [Hymenochirus boettgeri]
MASTAIENAEPIPSDYRGDHKMSKMDGDFPLKVLYCGVCSLPTEYCEYMPDVTKCRQWLEKNFPDEFAKLTLGSSPRQETGIPEGQVASGEEEEKKKQKREIELKDAQRFFAQKFSCGASVTGEDEIIIQGDFTDDIIDVIQEKWPEVDDDSIEDLGEVKK